MVSLPNFVKKSFLNAPEIYKCQFLDQKNTGKCSQKVARQRLTRQRLTHFSSFDHYENASIFGEGL